MAADNGFLDVALAPVGEPPPPGRALNDALDNALGDDFRFLRRGRRGDVILKIVFFFLRVRRKEGRSKRLRQF